MTTKKEKSLDNFTWGEDSDSFFGIAEAEPGASFTEDDVNEIKDEEETEEETEDTTVKDKEKDKQKEDSKEDENSEEDKEDEKENRDKKEKVKFFDKTEEDDGTEEVKSNVTSLVKNLKEKEVFSSLKNFEFDEKKEYNEDDLEEILESEIQARLEEEIEAFGTGLTEDDKNFIKFRQKGGKLSDYFQSLQTTALLEDIKEEDLVDEKTQEEFLYDYYANFEEMADEEIEDKIEWLKERGKLEEMATTKYKKVQEIDKKQKDTLLKQQEDKRKDGIKKHKEYKEDLKKTLDTIDNVGSVKISKKDKTVIFDYLMLPNIKLESGKVITGFQKDLAEIYNDKKKLVALAKIIKEDFELKDLSKNTEVVKDIKKKLATGTKSGSRTLSDYF